MSSTLVMSSATRKIALKKGVVLNVPSVNDDGLQLGGALDRQLNHDKPNLKIPVIGSGVAYKVCQW